jgi:hypothetical protein
MFKRYLAPVYELPTNCCETTFANASTIFVASCDGMVCFRHLYIHFAREVLWQRLSR